MIGYLIFWIAVAFFTGGIAESKGRSTLGWFILGALFNVLALVAVGMMPNLKGNVSAPTNLTHVRCPDCKELVLMDARKCKHCGSNLIPYNDATRLCPGCKKITKIGYGTCAYCSQHLDS